MSHSVGFFGAFDFAESNYVQKVQDGKNKAKRRVTENDINLSPSPIRMMVVMVVKVAGCHNLVC